jgi:hypothetical protein
VGVLRAPEQIPERRQSSAQSSLTSCAKLVKTQVQIPSGGISRGDTVKGWLAASRLARGYPDTATRLAIGPPGCSIRSVPARESSDGGHLAR